MAVDALLISGTSAANAGYSAIAAGHHGSSFVRGYATMEQARDAAVGQCRGVWGDSCSISTAEDDSWYFAAGSCDGEPYTGASPQGPSSAQDMVYAKGSADGRKYSGSLLPLRRQYIAFFIAGKATSSRCILEGCPTGRRFYRRTNPSWEAPPCSAALQDLLHGHE